MPNFIVAIAAGVLFVEAHNIHHSLRVFLLFLLRDTILLKQALPFFGKTSELTGLIIVADVGDVDWILWRRNLHVATGRSKHTVDESGEACLLALSRSSHRGVIAIVGIPLLAIWPLGLAMCERIHSIG